MWRLILMPSYSRYVCKACVNGNVSKLFENPLRWCFIRITYSVRARPRWILPMRMQGEHLAPYRPRDEMNPIEPFFPKGSIIFLSHQSVPAGCGQMWIGPSRPVFTKCKRLRVKMKNKKVRNWIIVIMTAVFRGFDPPSVCDPVPPYV